MSHCFAREKKQEIVPDVYKSFMLAIVDVASHGKDTNNPATSVRQLQRVFYHDDRRRHDGKDKKDVEKNVPVPSSQVREQRNEWLGSDSVSGCRNLNLSPLSDRSPYRKFHCRTRISKRLLLAPRRNTMLRLMQSRRTRVYASIHMRPGRQCVHLVYRRRKVQMATGRR